MDTGAVYDGYHRNIVINSMLDIEPDSLSALLVHEGTHAKDHMTGLLVFPKQNIVDHIQPELRAYRAQVQYWAQLHPYGKRMPRNELEVMLNRTLAAWYAGNLDNEVSRKYSEHWYANMGSNAA